MIENQAIKILQGAIKKPNTQDGYLGQAVTMAIQALEKQIPKKVYHFTDDDTFETSCCGIDVTNEDYKYCPECGQLLGEVEEVREYDGE